MVNKQLFLLTGSNQDDPLRQLSTAKNFIAEHIGEIKNASSIYVTAAWGLENQPDFLNQVLQIQCMLNPETLMQRILSIEHLMGRVRTTKNAPRRIDIDILYWGDMVLNAPTVTIPHPHIKKRKFVLIPLCEIAPDFIDPLSGKNISHLLEICPDVLDVRKM